MTQYLLGLDSGLTVTKAVVFRTNGTVVAQGKCSVPRIEDVAHHVERDMAQHWKASARAVRAALESAAQVEGNTVTPAAVAIAGHGDGLYLLDRGGKPLGPAATSLDSRAQKLVEGWDADGTTDRALTLCGQQPFPASPSALLAHIRDNEPDRYARIGAILSCKDWLRHCLTGDIGTDFTDASVAFTDMRSQSYSTEALALFGLGDLSGALPPVHLPGAVAGHVTREAAAATGLPMGLPVAAGLHDVVACAVGSGVTGPDVLALVAGTYSINETFRTAPRSGPGWLTRNGLMPGQWNCMSISPASSANLDWFVQQAARDALATDDPFSMLQKELDAVEQDPSDILYLPYLFGSPYRSDMAGAFLGLRGWHGRGHMLRAVAEGIAFNHRQHVDALDPERRIASVRLTGGSSRNPYFAQMMADTLERRVEVPATLEAGALGVAICAGLACGIYTDWEEARARTTGPLISYEPGGAAARLRQGYARYRDAAAALIDLQAKAGRI
ncbi:FGGY-family carbohydrate kinase [Limimaricola litoreus]|uniref:Carbohydrate kinase n=1 Tax=Limimaricola litoreus TaxID=2955316 RepID=A0A9X2FSS7_9RHOB|nr:FGGY-family carbohydrate kinase [Limimaricola litoreus]MCP1170015.1 carbohydrate kinase [Limimaricola litoreus]